MHFSLPKRICLSGYFVVALLLTGCLPAQTPGQTTSTLPAGFDVSKVTCPGIDAARKNVLTTYDAILQETSDTYLAAIKAFETDLNACLEGIWKKGPCDDQWEELQKAYKEVSAQVSDDNLYNTYKAAKGKRDACFAKVKADDYTERKDTNTNKEKMCRDDFQQARDAAERLYYETRNTAKAQRDAALAALDALQKECNKPKTGATAGEGTVGVANAGGEGDGTTPPVQEITPDAAVCQPTATPPTTTTTPGTATIPGANTQPRTGKSPDMTHKDILKELLQAAAEDVVGSPIPVSAISDQIFAVMVCAKLRTRLAELEMEQSDAQLGGQRSKEIRLRKKLADYNHAMQVWCAIAEGKPPLNLKDDMQQIQDATASEDEGTTEKVTCETAADCGEPACCSATEIGTRTCTNGTCASQKKPCPAGSQCGGKPAMCFKTQQVISYQGKYIPVEQISTPVCSDCGGVPHRHANAGSVVATDGTKITDPGNGCAYGKKADTPIISLSVPVK